MIPIDLGATAPEDHYYLVHAMLKQRCREDMTARGWTFAPIQGAPIGEGIIHFHRHKHSPALLVRLPGEDLGWLFKLAGQEIRLSHHMLRLSEPVLRDVRPAPVLLSPMVVITSGKEDHGVRGEEFGLHVGKRLGAMLGRIDFGVSFGPRRYVHIAGARHFGHSVTVQGLRDNEAIMLLRDGIGEGRGMGLGAFWRQEDLC